MTDDLRQRLARALITRIKQAVVPQPQPWQSGAIGSLFAATEFDLADAVLVELQPELDALAALRQVARGYCPHCGRGDASPTAEQWEQMRRERDGINRMYLTAMGDLGIAINRLDHIRDAATWIRRNYPGLTHVNDRLAAALDEPSPGPAATQATDHPKEQPGV
jgi:hypothetical protein